MGASEYIAYLLSEAGKSSCVRGGSVLQISHDEVNRFLVNSDFSGKDLFERAKAALNLTGGVLSVDDTVIDKPYSNPAELVGFFWSGLHHKSVKGINLILLNYTDLHGVSLPVNWRVYRHLDNKTKNDYFRDMLNEVFSWGLHPAWVTADCWYSSIENLKFLRNKEVGFMVGLESSRIISTVPHHYERVGAVEIGPAGLYTHLKGFDYVKVFRTVDTEDHERHYALYGNQQHPTPGVDAALFKALKQKHWHIEQAFRAVKQLVHAGHFFVRRTTAVKTHLYCVLRALHRLLLWTKDQVIPTVYALHDQIFLHAQRQFIQNLA
jgi:Transposase DDE domain